jgi:hypothetical protein
MVDRAQSEALGYILLFSILVLAVALVSVSGEAGLVELRDNQRTANMEQGFVVLAGNVDDVSQGGVPSRATELSLSGGRLSLGRPVTVTVRAETGESPVFEHSRTLRPIVYRAPDRARLVYATGAVTIRGEEGGTAMLREPPLSLSSNQTIVPIVNTTLNRQQLRNRVASVDGESRVLVRTERRTRRVVASTNSSVTVTVTVDSPRAPAWATYLNETAPVNFPVSGGTVTCTYTTDRAAVVATRVAVSFE